MSAVHEWKVELVRERFFSTDPMESLLKRLPELESEGWTIVNVSWSGQWIIVARMDKI